MRKLLSIIILISAIAFAFYVFVIKSDTTIAAWYDLGWNYRKSLTLSRPSGTVSNYQMKLNLSKFSTATPSASSEYVYHAANTGYDSIAVLDSTHFVAVYYDAANSNYGTAVIGTVSGSSVSYGSEYVFHAADTGYSSAVALDSTHFVVTYRDAANSNYGTAVIGTVSGDTISYGSEYVFNSGASYVITVSILDSTHFVVVYKDAGNSNYGTAIIGTVSGDTISYGSEYVFNAATTDSLSVTALDSTHFAATYSDWGNSTYGTVVIGTVSGDTISYGSEYVFNAASTSFNSVSALDSTHFVVVYDNAANYGTAIIGTVSGSTISYGSEYVFHVGATGYVWVSTLDSTHFAVVYQDTGSSTHGKAMIGTVSGSTISYGLESVFNAATTNNICLSTLDSAHFVVVYQDAGNSNYGTAVIGTTPNVYLDSHSRDDFNDLRFTASNGTTLLPYWIESSTAASASAWVKFDSIGTTATTFYMYYGNASATAVSNGTNTFILFDDFERGNDGDTIGGSWTEIVAHVHISTEYDIGDVAGNFGTRSGLWQTSAASGRANIPITMDANKAIRFNYYDKGSGYSQFGFGDSSYTADVRFQGGTISVYDGSSWVDTTLDTTYNVWGSIEFKDIVLNSTMTMVVDGNTKTGIDISYASNKFDGKFDFTNKAGGAFGWYDAFVDNFMVRNYASPEPTWSTFGSEEPAPTPTPTPTITPTPTPTPTPIFSNVILVGRWRFDGNAKDSTPYGHNGTVTGASLTTDRKGGTNKAYSFNGTSDHILIGNVGGPIKSISFWMQANTTASKKIINLDGTAQIELNGSSNVMATSFPGATVYVDGSSASANIPDTNWHLVTITDPTGVTATTFDIGGVSSSYFSGKIDDVRIYNSVLSQTDITKLYETYDTGIAVSDLQKGLLGQWKFDGNAKDATPYGNNGTITGAVLTGDRDNQSNKAYLFNGTSNHILVGNVGSGIKTITFWMQANTTASKKIINIDGTKQIELNGSSNVVATSFPSATVYVDGSVGSTITDTNWHQVMITDSTGVTGSTFDIGAVSSSYFSGKIDDVRIYNRVLSQAEATSLAGPSSCAASCPTAGTCQTGGGCSNGSCVAVSNVVSGQDPNNNCSQAYSCSGYATRLRNMCNGSGSCADIDSAASDCNGICSSYCSSGSCISTDTSAGTCTLATNARVVSGGDGHCTSGSCITDWSGCGQPFTDSRDSKIYATVSIGAQCWMKQNLNIGVRVDGGANQDGYSGTTCTTIKKYCYDNTDANCDSNNNPNYPDGGLYQWAQAMCGSTAEGVQGICPTGWHVPTDAEYKTLEIYLGLTQAQADAEGIRGTNEGTKLKPNGSSGYEGNINGWYSYDFSNRTAVEYIITSTQYDSTYSWRRLLSSDTSTITRDYYGVKSYGMGTRCLKN